MGFRTLAIQERSREVWNVLGAVKTGFGSFGGVIQKVQKKLQDASNVVDQAATRTRAMQRTLRSFAPEAIDRPRNIGDLVPALLRRSRGSTGHRSSPARGEAMWRGGHMPDSGVARAPQFGRWLVPAHPGRGGGCRERTLRSVAVHRRSLGSSVTL
jgi:hypothetical protein